MTDEKTAAAAAGVTEVDFGPRQAAIAWGPLGAMLQVCSVIAAIHDDVRQAWIMGRRHPLAAVGVVQKKIATPGRPPINRLVGVTVPSDLVERLSDYTSRASRIVAEAPDLPIEKDPLESRARARIVSAVYAFVRFTAELDPEQREIMAEALGSAAIAFLNERGLPLVDSAAEDWTSFSPKFEGLEDGREPASGETNPPPGETDPARDETRKADPETAAAGARELARDFDVTGALEKVLQFPQAGADTCKSGEAE